MALQELTGKIHASLARSEVPLRIILFIAVVALFIDAYFYSGAYTQATFVHVAMAADQFVDFISDTVTIGPNGSGTNTAR